MRADLECEGQVRLGDLPWEVSERLAQFSGNWLGFTPQGNTIVVRKSLPVGCPASTAVSCELITILESLTPELRRAIPGGEIIVRAQDRRLMRFAVEKGEIRIQWPTQDYSRATRVAPAKLLKMLARGEGRITGWARFAGTSSCAAEIEAFVRQFGGLYPEGDIPSECEQNIAYVPFKSARVDPDELLSRLQGLAVPVESLQAELDVTCAAPGSEDREFRILIRNGRVEALRPSLWQ
jgi:hypothetical protein